ncbi:MAG TPA: STAS domain-containing protein [Dermatophilaceae bacterium]|nr:STAS domain-containing protein [Dermatophilaceae bacterium]
MDLTISTQERDDVVLVSFRGDVDVYSAPTLRERLDRLVTSGHKHLVLDLQDVTFMDSTGLGILVGRLKLTRIQKGSLRVVCTVPRILRVLEITGLDKVLSLYDDRERAIADAMAEADGTDSAVAG